MKYYLLHFTTEIMIVFFQRERGSKNRLNTCTGFKIAPSNDVSLSNDKSDFLVEHRSLTGLGIRAFPARNSF